MKNNKFQYSLFEVEHLCGSANKGYEYFKKSAVSNLEFSKSSTQVVVNASVKGSKSNLYKVHMSVELSNGEIIKVGNSCSCPVGYRCKHVSAVFFEFCRLMHSQEEEEIEHPLEFSDRPEAPAWNAWLEKLKVNLTPKLQASIKEQLLPIYILHIKEQEAFLEIKMTRYLKSGNFKQPIAFQSEKHLPMIEKSDLDLISQIYIQKNLHERHRSDKKFSFSELQRFFLVKELILSNRCFLAGNYTQPLKLGSPSDLSCEWQPDASGNFILNFLIENCKKVELLLFAEPWYVDLENIICGPLNTTHSNNTLANFLKAPKVPIENVSSFKQSCEKFLPNNFICLPQEPVIDVEIIEFPTPVLRLFGVKDIHYYSTFNANDPLIEMKFIYKTFEISLFDNKKEIFRFENNKYYKIVRNLKEEAKFLNQLFKTPINFAPEIFFPYSINYQYHDYFSFKKEDWKKKDISKYLNNFAKQGWKIVVEESFPFKLELEIDDWYVDVESIESGNSWFDIELGIVLDNHKVNLISVLQQLLKTQFSSVEDIQNLDEKESFSIVLEDGKVISVQGSRLRSILMMLIDLHSEKTGKLSLPRHKASELYELKHILGQQSVWKNAEQLEKAIEKIQILHNAPEISSPVTLKAALRPYQHKGLNWLQALRENAFSGILADDMGLGKTLQTLTHLLLEKEQGRMKKPSLILTPTSLVSNWKAEAEKFTPTLKIHVHHGLDRKSQPIVFEEYDIILSTYPLLVKDKELLFTKDFYYFILDEAQTIKNAHSQATQIVCKISADHRLCLTGTPMENHLGELWTLFHFLSPGLLGSQKQFNKHFRIPIEKKGNISQSSLLAKRLAPFILRRLKEEVTKDLPPKTEILQKIPLEGSQRDLYETIRTSMNQKIQQIVEKQGLARSQIIILDALLKMRQVCCDPRLVKLDSATKVKESKKLSFLITFLQKLIEEKRRILLFSSFSSMLELIEAECVKTKICYVKLTGETINRAEVIEKFQTLQAPLFLISLKAGGTGLNLTAADTVIHYDPWWNPAAEQQATDRAHRIGQDKPIFVYKLITEGTIEEKILKLQEKKQALIDSLFGEQKEHKNSISLDDLKDLFAPIDN